MVYWKDLFGSTKLLIPSYDTTSNRATFDPEYREKRIAAHGDPNHIFKIVDAKEILSTTTCLLG